MPPGPIALWARHSKHDGSARYWAGRAWKYSNQQLTSAEVIAELVELACEVAADGSRGAQFTPPTEFRRTSLLRRCGSEPVLGGGPGRRHSGGHRRELVSVMRRDVRTDWTVRDDIRATLRSSIKRLLIRFAYPPDKQPEAIKLVMEQMESMAPRFVEARA